MAFRDRKYDRVIALCNDVLGLEPENLPALKRLGSRAVRDEGVREGGNRPAEGLRSGEQREGEGHHQEVPQPGHGEGEGRGPTAPAAPTEPAPTTP